MRLIDLHCNWAIQYACESTQYNPAHYGDVPGKLGQLDGYLSGVTAAVLVCGRRPGDWAEQADPWHAAGEMIARYQAEFPGRVLVDRDDAARWLVEPEDGICWGMLGIEGLDVLVRGPGDLEKIPGLFDRGVRFFQLRGGAGAGDDRGLTELERAALDSLAGMASAADQPIPRPVIDVAALSTRGTEDVLAWFEADRARADRLPLVRSCGGEFSGPARDHLTRLRALGAVVGLSVGPPFVESAESLITSINAIAAVPFKGQPGYQGIGIGTKYPELISCPRQLANVSKVTEWLMGNYPSEIALALMQNNARTLLLHAAGWASGT